MARAVPGAGLPGGEDDLVAAARAGDRASYERLVLRYERPLFRFAFLLLRDTQAATAAARLTFADAYGPLAAGEAESDVLAWLLRQLLERCRSRAVRAGRVQRSLARLPGLPAPVPPEVATVRGEMNRRVLAALLALSLDERCVLYLHFFLELDFERTAAVLALDLSEVDRRLGQALDHLVAVLNDVPQAAGTE